MKVLETRVYQGPNQWAHFPVILQVLDLGALEHHPTVMLPHFVEKLTAAIPSLVEHGCSYGTAGGFLRRMQENEGTWMGHVLEHVAIEIQNLAGARVSFGKTRGNGAPGQYNVVFEYEEAQVGEQAAALARKLLLSILPDEVKLLVPEVREARNFDFQEQLEDFIRWTQKRALGPSTASLVRAAKARGIPWIRLNEYSLIQFGHGKYQKRIQATVTSETRHIAVQIASDKEETNKILGDLGLPVPRQRLVRDAENAVRAAERLGYPVVVKPLDANHGRGVSIGLTDAAQVRVGFDVAREHARSVIVETFIEGLDHRMLVINNQLVAVAKRVPGHVVGDGIKTIAQLVDIVNQDPNRGIGHEKILTRLELDHQANEQLSKVGLTTESIPDAGKVVYLRATGNLSTGGTAVDVTDIVHPDNREMAVRAVQAIGLDVGGVDFLSPDISRSYKEVGGAICEINAAPGFRMHVAPTEGTPRDVAGAVMDMLFPPGTPTRIPIAAVTGTNGKTTTARMLAHIHKMRGKIVGLASTDGVYIDGWRKVEGDMTGPVAAQMVLRDPTVDTAVLETARGGLLRAGMGYRYCNVGAVLNVAEDHLGLKGIDTLEQLAQIKRIVVEVARDAAVLNADDAHCLRMADHTDAKNIWYVTMNQAHSLVREHIRAGGSAVVLEGGINGHMITLYHQGAQMPLLWTHLIPATLEGRAMHNVQNAMFAAAMAYAMDVRLDDIRTGLRTFDSTFFQAPGRMNVFAELPFRVIVDYGHNAAAVKAMVQTVLAMEPTGKKRVVVAVPGDRRDADVTAIARELAGRFDQYICRRDDNPRGRGDTEIPEMLKNCLVAEGVPEDTIHVVVKEADAVDFALREGQPGDLILVFADQVTRTWKQVIRFRPEKASAATDEDPGTLRLTPELELMELPEGSQWVRDDRGVRLARGDED
ncbi:MAG: cyanophycin synthetase [Myxococcales bacterium]|nr:cyanophycin synthetase [Myxococcales bacterium]